MSNPDRRTKKELLGAIALLTAEHARVTTRNAIGEEALKIKHAEVESVHASLQKCLEAKESVLALLKAEQHQAGELRELLEKERAYVRELEATVRRRDVTIVEVRHERDVSTRATNALAEFIAEGVCRFLS